MDAILRGLTEYLERRRPGDGEGVASSLQVGLPLQAALGRVVSERTAIMDVVQSSQSHPGKLRLPHDQGSLAERSCLGD